MGAKRFDCLNDFLRWGMNVHLECRNGHCGHTGIVGSHEVCLWFRAHRWSDHLDWNALNRFRCTRCGDRAGRARPTENKPTVVDFFPADERGWQMLVRRLRG